MYNMPNALAGDRELPYQNDLQWQTMSTNMEKRPYPNFSVLAPM